MDNSREKTWLVWIFRVLWLLYSLLLLAIAHFNGAPLGKAIFSVALGTGCWIGCYLYFSKQDIHFFSSILKHEENRFTRALAMFIILATIHMIPFGLHS